MKVRFKKLAETAKTPTKAHPTDAGFDLYVSRAHFEGGLWVCHSDIAFEIPEGHVGLLFPRSSISRTCHLLTNSVGIIDADYRGEVSAKFACITHDRRYEMGERFAQLIIIPIPAVELTEADELSETARGAGGYGSTGQ